MTNQILPPDYDARVYAGWMGKCIGVRFGAPLENWTYEEIRDHLGELTGYVREDRGKIFKPDDDTSMPMVRIRALEDYGFPKDLTPEQCGETMLNYIADGHGTVWWGGYGISSAHTAYINLQHGITAPQSGSIAMNGTMLAEQIGGQIFSNIWGLVAPNQPELAANLSAASSSVTHDGGGIHGARFMAAITALAFSEHDPRRLIERGLDYVSADSEYTKVVRAMLDFYTDNPQDWRVAFAYLKENFGDHLYPGVVHIIPNTGVVVMGMLYGEGDFSKTLQITNMAGWDTDCNVGNVGAVLGVIVGVDGIESHWCDPMNDLLIAANLIGTRNILTISQCADLITFAGRKLLGLDPKPKPRIHFRYPRSTQNFVAEGKRGRPIHLQQAVIDDVPALKVSIRKLNKKGEIRLYTRTYYRPSELISNYYGAMFTPLIFPGQTLSAEIYLPADAPHDIKAAVFVYDDNHEQTHQPEGVFLTPGEWQTLTYEIPALTDACLSKVGIVVRNVGANWVVGSIALREMSWGGTTNTKSTFALEREETGAISQWTYLRGAWELADNAYRGSGPTVNETYTGDIDWRATTFKARVIPLLGQHHRINVRVQGARRSYAFGLSSQNTIAIYKNDGEYKMVKSAEFLWEHGKTYHLTLQADGNHLRGTIESDERTQTIEWQDKDHPYLSGQVGLSNSNANTRFESVHIIASEIES